MTTYLIIGLILLLAVYLVRGHRARAAAETPTASPSSSRFPLRARRRPAPEPASPAAADPRSPAGASSETAAARSNDPLIETAPSTASMLGEVFNPMLDWTPAETIVEPGWPLPGEISGGWTPAPEPTVETPFRDDSADSVAVMQWTPGDGPGGSDDDSDQSIGVSDELPSAEEWAMAAIDSTPLEEESGPPLWIPGQTVTIDPVNEIEPSAHTEEAIAWQTESASVPDAPPLSWEPEESGSQAADPPAWLQDSSAPAETVETLVEDEPADDETVESAEIIWTDPTDEIGIAPDAEVVETLSEPAVAPEPETDPAPIVAWNAVEPELAGTRAPMHVDAGEQDLAPHVDAEEEGPALVVDWAEAVVGLPATAEEDSIPEQCETIADLVPVLLDGLVPFTRVCDRVGVTPRMLALMRILADSPLSVAEQANRLKVSRPVVADLCARLEALGLAERERLENDRRRVRVALTEAGLELYAESVAAPEPTEVEAVLSQLTPAERAHLLNGLRALAAPA